MANSKMAALASLAALLAATAGCRSDGTGPETQEPVRPFTVQEQQVSSANSGFGLALLRALHEAEQKPNLLASPLSVSMALGMTMNGAAEQTYDAMRTTLGFGQLAESEINEAYAGLIRQLRARDPGVEFRLANALWHERTFSVEPPFLEAARTHFDAEVGALDFSDPDAPRIISRWAEEQTGGRIRDLIESIDPLEKLFLVNAVYFKAPWTVPFEPDATRDGPFTRADGSTVAVPLMANDAAYPYYEDDDVVAIELLYADTAFSMVLAQPAEGRSLDALVASLTAARWDDWMRGLRFQRVRLVMPKFRFDYDVDLRSALRELGMAIAFDPQQADFRRINPAHDDLHITRVVHKSFIDVHELGTEAAAATAVGMGVTSLPPEVRFDRPFLFAIRERASGALLFLGRIGDPRTG